MARIPEAEVERLKNEVSVERLVIDSGIALKKSGKDLLGCCPFHADDTASLVVTPAKHLWHCFGCGIGGGPIDWVMKKNGISFRHAVELLREGISSLAAGVVQQSTIRALPVPVEFDADNQKLLNQVANYYHETLKQSPEALAYLSARGFSGEAAQAAIDTFKLGFANRTLGLRLPEKNRVAGAKIRNQLIEIGLYRESGHEHFNGSLVIPIFDEVGNVTEMYGRKITDRLRPGTPMHLYLPGPHRGVWNLDALKASQEIILCESLIDALTFWCAGFRNVTTSYGIEGFTDDHLAVLKQYGTKRILIAYDRDEAGERGAAKVKELLLPAGLECFRIQFPKGMDVNEYALKVTPANKSLGLLIRKAVWIGAGTPQNTEAPTLPPSAPAIVTRTTEQVDDTPPTLAAKETSVKAVMTKDNAESTITKDVSIPIIQAPVLPASPMPSLSQADIPVEINGEEIHIRLSDRRYRIRGLQKNVSFALLKINLLVSLGDTFYVDTLDLYSAKQRQSYIHQAAIELRIKEEILKSDLGRVLLKLEQIQEQVINKALKPAEPVAVSMNNDERDAALSLLRDPRLIDRILIDFDHCGLMGEETNKLIGYLAAVSRKLDKPLGIVIQSSSAAGKTSLMDAILAFVPEEDKVKYSAMTGQSLFYMGETNLKHKALAIVEEAGASRASYALKLLQSEGELTIASTGKDAQSGNLITQQYRVEGPVALLFTTTARDVDEELMNRCLVLAVDEGREQTRNIHQRQRDKRTLEGLLAKHQKNHLIQLHQNAQRLLRPLEVLNPYAQYLTFPDQTTRLRRDHEKYLTLIDTIAFLHQHQREIKSLQQGKETIEYIEVNINDIEIANRIAEQMLSRSLDELPPQTRRLLSLIDHFVEQAFKQQEIQRSDYRFSRRELREAIHWGDTQLRLHLERLVELEYLVIRREGAGGKYLYELVYTVDDQQQQAQLAGLINVSSLESLVKNESMIQKSRGNDTEVAGRSRGDSGPFATKSRGQENSELPEQARHSAESMEETQKTHSSNENKMVTSSASYAQTITTSSLVAHA